MKPNLTLAEFESASQKYNLISLFIKLDQGEESPVTAFAKLSGDYSYLLESSEKENIFGRYSFMGSAPAEIISGNDTPLPHLKARLASYKPMPQSDLPPFHGGLVGYLSYETVGFIEPTLKFNNPDDLHVPLYHFLATDTCVAFDHLEKKIFIICNVMIDHHHADHAPVYQKAIEKIEGIQKKLSASSTTLPEIKVTPLPEKFVPNSNTSKEKYKQALVKAQEYIRAGDIFQVVYSQRFELPIKQDPLTLYRKLRQTNPSPYMFLLKFKDYFLIGSSPEILVRLENGQAILRPIAGTRPRGKSSSEDQNLEQELLKDEKELAEHLMLVDLARNDLGRVCEPGSVKTSRFKYIERFSHVMHIVSNVVGKLKAGLDAVDLLAATFPAGTVSGAPKIRAMQIIEELEISRRNTYAGTVSYFDYSGNMDSAITLRTLLVKDGKGYIQAGGGIVADSDPEKEYQETIQKASALLQICL
jgi:anthranilate synthase component 1